MLTITLLSLVALITSLILYKFVAPVSIDSDLKLRLMKVIKESKFVPNTPLDIYHDGRRSVFVSGVLGHSDKLLMYSPKHQRVIDIIEDSGLNDSTAETYGAIAADLDGDGYMDLIISRSNGIKVYKSIKGSGFFVEMKIDTDANN